jgi:hypothetical protein
MAERKPNKRQKPYHSPVVTVYGDIRTITGAQSAGTNMDGGVFPNVKTA